MTDNQELQTPAGEAKRPGWRSGVVVVVTFCLGILTTAVALQPPRVPRDQLLPADGSVQAVEVEGLLGQVETAALRGRQVRGLGRLGALAVESVPADELASTQWWRLGFTVADPPPIAGNSGPLVPTTEFLLLRGSQDDLELVGVSLQHLGWVYTDAVGLPATGERELTGRFTAPDGTPGEHRTRVTASTTDGCRAVTIRSELNVTTVDLALELCRGRFVRFTIAIPGSGASDFVAVERDPAGFDGQFDPAGSRPVEGGWKLASAKLVAADSALGGVAGWDVSSYLDPVALRDETVVVARQASQDLIAIDPAWQDGEVARIRWVAHPGGSIRTLVAAGDLTVTATSERALVGYGPNGIRQWRVELPDLVAPPLVTDAAGVLYAATLNGWVSAIDLRTGQPRWQQRVGDHLLTGPALVPDPAGGVVAGTADGSLVRLGADGSLRWTVAPSGDRPAVELVAATAGQVFVVTQDVRAHAATDGAKQWAVSKGSDVPTGLATSDTMLGVGTSQGVWALEPATGDTLWWASEPVGAVRGRGSVMFTFSPDLVSAGLADPSQGASWKVPGLVPQRGRCMCARTPDGWLFSAGTTVARLR